MKSEKTNKIDEFWVWFSGASRVMFGNVENPTFSSRLDEWIRQLNPKLSWEIGPGVTRRWQLVISPNLDKKLRDEARAIVARAPELSGWEFHSARQSKDWDYRFELESDDGEDRISLDASNWRFVLLRYPDGFYEVLLRGDDLQLLNEDERWQAAAVVLESILGEDTVIDRIDHFALLSSFEPRFESKQRPIQDLHRAILGHS